MKYSKESGGIGWIDLTVPNADEIRDFYKSVAGWQAEGVSMGEYNDFNMKADSEGNPVAGICHARGSNADFPPQWLIYINVDDLSVSLESCKEKGGEVVAGPFEMGESRYAVIRDPAGAVCALFQH